MEKLNTKSKTHKHPLSLRFAIALTVIFLLLSIVLVFVGFFFVVPDFIGIGKGTFIPYAFAISFITIDLGYQLLKTLVGIFKLTMHKLKKKSRKKLLFYIIRTASLGIVWIVLNQLLGLGKYNLLLTVGFIVLVFSILGLCSLITRLLDQL